jgi:16S rRNA (cytosine967-C5)-methyltransferase
LIIENPRQLALIALSSIHQGAFADVALDRAFNSSTLKNPHRSLVTELVYGCIRRKRSLDALIDRLAKKPASQQPPQLRPILHLGLYQLRYLNIPDAVAVNSTVELAKTNGFSGLTGFVNGLLRQYLRLTLDPLESIQNPVERLGVLHSFPDWIIQTWLEQLGFAATEQLCIWMNQSPAIDLRVNPLQTDLETVANAMKAAGISVSEVPHLPQALKLTGNIGAIQNLPGFDVGWWTVQDSSAQLVTYLLDPQPGEVVIDACAAPGGKTTHIAELIGDKGQIWAIDAKASRLKKLQENAHRLNLHSIKILTADSRTAKLPIDKVDRVLLDAPCSGLGTLHRRTDARWRQTPEKVKELATLQQQLLQQVATWVKPGGILVYATCTVNPLENEAVVRSLLDNSSQWQIEPSPANSPAAAFASLEGWIKVWPHQHQMDGFFMVRLKKAV